MTSYRCSIVTVALCRDFSEIFSVGKYRDFQIPVKGQPSSDVVLETRVLVSRRVEDKKMKVLVLVLDHEVLVLNINWSWSWSRSWRKRYAVFKDICCNFWRQWERHTMAFLRDNKSSLPFGSHCLREPSALHAHQPHLRGYLTMGPGYLLGHTDASKSQCIDCGKLFSLGSNNLINKESKHTR